MLKYLILQSGPHDVNLKQLARNFVIWLCYDAGNTKINLRSIVALSKNDLELARIHASATRYGGRLNLINTFLTLGTILGCVYMIVGGLKFMVTADPAGVSAIAEVVKNLNIGGILAYVLALGSTGGWYMERQGKKRLLGEFAENRRQLESNDAYRGSSGLTDSGDTPNLSEGI